MPRLTTTTISFVPLFALLALGRLALAVDPPSTGLLVGHDTPAFQVVKCGGAEGDGVKVGDELCYRCRWGGRPVALLFVRQTDAPVVALVRQLEARLAAKTEKPDSPLGVLVCVLADDLKTAERRARRLAEAGNLKRAAVVAPVEVATGPKAYDLDADAAVTVLIYRKTQVIFAHAFATGKLDAEGAAKVVADFDELLKQAK